MSFILRFAFPVLHFALFICPAAARPPEWPFYQGDPGFSGRSPDVSLKPPFKLVWTYRLDGDATGDAGGGVTVAVYPRAADGGRGKVRILFVIATTQGNSRTGSVTLPEPAAGEAVSRLPVVVVVENASGRRNSGEYTLTLSP